jgi:2,3-bisphosphoglycerate-dependent phosphoglycerate mutase
MSKLVLVRHGESEWNAKGVWTGWTDIPLTEKGREEAKKAASLLSDIHFDYTYTSKLVRASETLELMKKELHLSVATIANFALNERDYGQFTGKNKWEIKKEIGDEAFQSLRRGWNSEVKGGETLKVVYDRVVPYFLSEVLPLLKKGKNVLVVAHGNSIRALVKYLESIPDEKIAEIEFKTGEIMLYEFDESGTVIHKERRGGL